MSVARISYPTPPSRPLGRFVLFACALVVLIVLPLLSYAALNTMFLNQKSRETPTRAQFFAAAIDDALSRLAHLPYVLSIDPTTLRALRDSEAEMINPTLATVAEKSGAEFVYLMDVNGRAIASSNYADSDSLVGNLYTFRPYFRDAVAGAEGRFYAVGVTTGRPGYFIAAPVRDESQIIHGVVVVKVGFDDLSRGLRDSGDLVFVTNDQGVVLASSDETLLYGLLSPLTAFARRTLEDQQQFGDKDLIPLDWQATAADRASLGGTSYLWTQAGLSQENWSLHLLSDVGDIRRQALLYVAAGLMLILSLIIAAAVYRAVQLRRALSISNADRQRLVQEIDDRKIAEAKLEKARTELARQNQLAALGQLSASITHELGQPISAMRNYLAAEEIANDSLPGALSPQMSGLVDRMQRIVDQLRLFGRNAPDLSEQFSAQAGIRAALALVAHTADQAGTSIRLHMTKEACVLRGQSNRFEQVIVNLLRNAIDATEGQDDGCIDLTLAVDDMITIEVADNGPGLGDLDMRDLQEPFFSTKPSGKGMGLGLAISAQIINETEGVLDAFNGPDRGAVFRITLPKAT